MKALRFCFTFVLPIHQLTVSFLLYITRGLIEYFNRATRKQQEAGNPHKGRDKCPVKQVEEYHFQELLFLRCHCYTQLSQLFLQEHDMENYQDQLYTIENIPTKTFRYEKI